MKTIQKACSVAILAMMCAACGSKKEAEEPKPMDPKDTFAGDQIRAKERAEAVEATTMEHKAEMDRAIEETGQ
jgi:rRNA maturation protein Nop10